MEGIVNMSASSGYNVSVNRTIEETKNEREVARMIHVIARPVIIICGTIGNLLSFYVMRRGSLKNVSTCLYLSILALTDTGKNN